MNKESAIRIKKHALEAIEKLTLVLNETSGQISEADYQAIKKSIGISIGRIQVDILDRIYAQHQDLNDLDSKG